MRLLADIIVVVVGIVILAALGAILSGPITLHLTH